MPTNIFGLSGYGYTGLPFQQQYNGPKQMENFVKMNALARKSSRVTNNNETQALTERSQQPELFFDQQRDRRHSDLRPTGRSRNQNPKLSMKEGPDTVVFSKTYHDVGKRLVIESSPQVTASPEDRTEIPAFTLGESPIKK